MRWCVREGHVEAGLVEVLMGRDNPLRQIPRLYGKVQARRPARWLSHEDGTDLGLRDEVLIRLGLAAMRAAEIIHLRVGDLRFTDAEPQICWIGKKRRARRIDPGPGLVSALQVLCQRREEHLGRRLRDEEPVLCCGRPGPRSRALLPERGITQTVSVQEIVTKRAAMAELGHVAPHDLRRTAAGLLHRIQWTCYRPWRPDSTSATDPTLSTPLSESCIGAYPTLVHRSFHRSVMSCA